MKVVSVSVGLPCEVESRGKRIRTSIFKAPVAGRVRVSALGLEGDRQSDLSVHGGALRAVCAYPMEHYAFWRGEFPALDYPWGAFGENLTTEGLVEDEAHIGDRYRIGTVEIMVTQPRLPCYKLGTRFNCPDMVRTFLHSGRTGFLFSVLREGEIGAGDAIEQLAVGDQSVTVSEITRLYAFDDPNRDLLRRASRLEALPEEWREHFRERLSKIG